MAVSPSTAMPASHIIEMIFLTPESFERIETIEPILLGFPAKIADGFFLLAVNDKPEMDANLSFSVGTDRFNEVAERLQLRL
jgi:hypothetical protein